MNKCKFKEGGITLVALVITIIVLLILAGISIQAITNTGLFANAKLAKEKTIKAEMQEAISIAIQGLQTEKLGGATLNDINEDWLNNEKLSERYNAIILNDNNGKKIRLKKNGVSLTCLIDINMNITICKAVEISYTVDKTTFKDNTVKIRITVMNDEKGLKTIEMPDGNIIDCNCEHEKEIEYTITLGQEYIIKIISEDESVDNEKIKIDSIPCNVTVELSIGAEMNNKSIVTDYGKTYENTITTTEKYAITNLTVTMDGKIITTSGNSVVDINTGKIKIENVTGDINVIVTTKKIEIQYTAIAVSTSSSLSNTSSKEENSVEIGTTLYINIIASLEGTKCSAVLKADNTKTIPYEVKENGKYMFKVSGTYNGKTIEEEKEVIVNQFMFIQDVVKYDAGDWTIDEIEDLKNLRLYDINKEKNRALNDKEAALNFKFGGFTYKGDTTNANDIESGNIVTSRNQSVVPSNGCGTPRYSGWQIMESEEKEGKKYVKKLVHAGSPENFNFEVNSTKYYRNRRAEYILSSGTRQTNYNSYKPRDWSMYKDKELDSKGYINSVHAMTYDEAGKCTSKIRNTGAMYWLANISSASTNGGLYTVRYDGSIHDYIYGVFGIRPVIEMNDKVYIKSGSGTEADPYILGKDQ